jgi:hypothetical protein
MQRPNKFLGLALTLAITAQFALPSWGSRKQQTLLSALKISQIQQDRLRPRVRAGPLPFRREPGYSPKRTPPSFASISPLETSDSKTKPKTATLQC